LEQVGVVLSSRWRWERPAFLLVKLDRLFDAVTQFGEYTLLIVPVTTPVEETRTTANKALIFF